MSSGNKHLCTCAFSPIPTLGNWSGIVPCTSGLSSRHKDELLSLSWKVEEINGGFELEYGPDCRQQSLTGQIGSDSLVNSKYKGYAWVHRYVSSFDIIQSPGGQVFPGSSI